MLLFRDYVGVPFLNPPPPPQTNEEEFSDEAVPLEGTMLSVGTSVEDEHSEMYFCYEVVSCSEILLFG